MSINEKESYSPPLWKKKKKTKKIGAINLIMAVARCEWK
jgi:hypothetical protein